MLTVSTQPLLEKLQLADEKNLLIQGLPSSVEKQFIKLSFAKNLTPLLKIKRIEFALIFSVSQRQLEGILKEVMPYLQDDAKLWIAFPKLTSKIASDLSRDVNWNFATLRDYNSVRMIALDNVWSAIRFTKKDLNLKSVPGFSSMNPAPGIDYLNKTVDIPIDLQKLFVKNKIAAEFFDSLAFTHRREYIEWIVSAKRAETRSKRLETTVEKLIAGKRNFNEK